MCVQGGGVVGSEHAVEFDYFRFVDNEAYPQDEQLEL